MDDARYRASSRFLCKYAETELETPFSVHKQVARLWRANIFLTPQIYLGRRSFGNFRSFGNLRSFGFPNKHSGNILFLESAPKYSEMGQGMPHLPKIGRILETQFVPRIISGHDQ